MSSLFNVTDRDGITILTVLVEKLVLIDHIQPVMREVELLVSGTPCRLIVDLSACTHHNGAFAVRMKQLKTKSVSSQLMLCGVHPECVELFTMVSFEQETPITASLNQMYGFLQRQPAAA